MESYEVNVEGLVLICEAIDWQWPAESGERFTISNLQPGDTVIGRRNSLEWKIGTVSERLWEKTLANGWMYCDELSFYPYNLHECRKVLEIKE